MIKIKMKEIICAVILILVGFTSVTPLDNGLARTPPMGWMSWARYGCNVDCNKSPKNCINEDLYISQGKKMVQLGFRDAGYKYVSIDDCWESMKRDPKTDQLLGNSTRFPRGMKYIGDELHRLGLKFGIYSDIGTYTCGHYPGTEGHFSLDAFTFANWGVDMLKLDGCYEDINVMNVTYPAMAKALNSTHRPILYLCSWAAYIVGNKRLPNYKLISQTCNTWRNYDDVGDSWSSIKGIILWYSKHWPEIKPFHGPGHFSDADMLIIGDHGLNYDESRTQFGMWSMWSAPLIISDDMEHLKDWEIALLQNKNVIDINQDELGEMASVVKSDATGQIWHKNLKDGCQAVAILYLGEGERIRVFNETLTSLGVKGQQYYYSVSEVFTGRFLGVFGLSDSLAVEVNIHGIQLLRFCKPGRRNNHYIRAGEREATSL